MSGQNLYKLDAGADVKRIVMSSADPFGKPVNARIYGDNFASVEIADHHLVVSEPKAFDLRGALIPKLSDISAMPMVMENGKAVLRIQQIGENYEINK